MKIYPQATPGRVSGLVQPVDFFPTVCELAGVEAPNGLQGHSFAEQLRGTGSGSRQYAITGRNLNDSWGTVPATITDGEWSLVYWPNKDLKYKNPPVRQETYANIGMPERRVEELFYLPNDPGQEKNVLASHPDEAKRLHAALLDLIAEADVEPEMAATYQRSPGENYHLE